MIVTILLFVALLFFVIVGFGVRFIYLLFSSQHIMQSSTKTKAIDVFLYLGIAISLITSVTNLLQILFLAIEKRFVDVLQGTMYYSDVAENDALFAVASLVVMFPLFALLSFYTSKNISVYLYKQELPIRKIMIYCTLFLSIATGVGTLVSVIYTYLGGEVSVRFLYKAGTVFLIALFLFAYYFYTLRRDYSKKTYVPLAMALVALFVVTLSVMWSISIIGSPKAMRAKKIDNVRLSDISRIQQEIVNHVQLNDALPSSLASLSNAFSGYLVPKDPVTNDPYFYRITSQPEIRMNYATKKKEMMSNAVFELCTTFDSVRRVNERGQESISSPMKVEVNGVLTPSVDTRYLASYEYREGDGSPFWNHGQGLTCFKRVMTPSMYYGR